MQNETNLSNEKINSLLNMLKSGSTDSGKLQNMLNDSQKQQVNSILSDPERLRQLLSSPQAQSLINKFRKPAQEEKDNGSS